MYERVIFFLGLDWVHFEPCEGGEKGRKKKKNEKRRERGVPETTQGPAKTWLQKMGRKGALSSLSSSPPLTLPKRNGAFVFYPTAWLSGCPSVCPSVCLNLGWLASNLVLRRYCTGQRVWFQHGILGSAFLFCWAYVLDCLSFYLCAS